ncbi:MAG: hypothetical protein HY043_10885 [Verrucomicrobia bacterium]|nr:hypothetical protein [Verrucomicrobiota bacterium]
MQTRSSSRRFTLVKASGVILMLGLWLGLSSLAVCPQLHQLLHKDSQSVDHFCHITHLSKSPWLMDGGSHVSVVPLLTALDFFRVLEFRYSATSNHRLSASRAPPAVYFLNTVVG